MAVIAIIAAVIFASRGASVGGGGPHLARLTVDGIISDDHKTIEAIWEAAKDHAVTGMIVSINSPGGTVSGGEAIYRALTEVAAHKPVVAVMNGLAASAGYMIAMPAQRVFARESTVTGSIGVIMETGEVSGLMGKLGVTAEAITSGPLKDQPSFTKPMSAQGREVLHGLVSDLYDQFVVMVANGRHMDPDKVRGLADGRAYTGRQALKLGLIDALGGEHEARAWLAAEKGIPDDQAVVDIGLPSLAERMLSGRLSPMLDGIWKSVVSQSVILDGPLALWQH